MRKRRQPAGTGIPWPLPQEYIQASSRVTLGTGVLDLRAFSAGGLISKAMALWLLNFSTWPTINLSSKSWQALQWECWVFAYSGMQPLMRGNKLTNPLPRRGDITNTKRWLSGLLLEVRDETGYHDITIRTSAWEGLLTVRNEGVLMGYDVTSSLPWCEAFKFQVHRVLTDPAVSPRLRFCKHAPCRRPFLATKRQAYCSPSCSQNHRTSEWRRKNREKFRAWRRQDYLKRQKRNTGQLRLRIQTSKRKGRTND